MALADQLAAQVVQSFSTKRLVELTRPEDASETTVDTTFLTNVCAAVIGHLDANSCGTYDDTDEAFVAIGVDGFAALAQYRIAATEGNERRWNQWVKSLETFRQTRRNDRIRPQAARDYSPRKVSARQQDDVIGGRPGRL